MIFLLDARDPGTVREWLAGERGRAVADRVRVLTYRDVLRSPRLPAETCVFGDLETATPALRGLAAEVWDELGRAGVRRLNDPRRVLGRYDLLRALHELGRNEFRAYRLSELPARPRFPVFVRRDREHDGALTDLLHDEHELRRALQRLSWPRTRHRRDDLLVVEYCQATGHGGLHLRLGAMRIGDAIIPRYYTLSPHWVVKTGRRLVDAAIVELEHRYMTENPHRALLRETCELAGIEYGRVDYGLVGDKPQVWEVNTNPSLGRRVHRRYETVTDEERALEEPIIARAHAAMREAFVALDAACRPGEVVSLRISRRARVRFHADRLLVMADKVRRATGAALAGPVLRALEGSSRKDDPPLAAGRSAGGPP